MSPILRRGLAAVILIAAVLTIALALPLQAVAFQSTPPPTAEAPRAPVAPARSGTASCSGWYYTIARGDTLNSIARRNGVSVNDIMRCNGLKSTMIYAGKRLLIPGKSAAAAQPAKPAAGACYHTVESGETLSTIAASYGTTAWYLQSMNYIPNPSMVYAGQDLRVPCGVNPAPKPATDAGSAPATAQGWYQVRAGDTVSKIAARLGVSSQDIIAANELEDPYTIYEGQWLRVP